VSSVAFASVAYLMRPIYRASAVMVPAESDNSSLGSALSSSLGQLGGLASLVGVGVGSSGVGTEEALAVMRSTQFTQSFIEERNLMPDLYPKNWDAASGKWKGSADEQPRIARAVKRFVTTISSVDQNKKTGLVTLSVDFNDRQKAALWANALVDKLNEEMRSRAIAKADASIGYLQTALAATAEVATRESINRLLESQIKQRMMANVSHEYAFRIVDRATPPEADDILRPNRLLLLATGPLLGLLLGALGALLFTTNKSRA
jgi:uncharacterized protein involved in exopolysaccharide biosynthesis